MPGFNWVPGIFASTVRCSSPLIRVLNLCLSSQMIHSVNACNQIETVQPNYPFSYVLKQKQKSQIQPYKVPAYSIPQQSTCKQTNSTLSALLGSPYMGQKLSKLKRRVALQNAQPLAIAAKEPGRHVKSPRVQWVALPGRIHPTKPHAMQRVSQQVEYAT